MRNQVRMEETNQNNLTNAAPVCQVCGSHAQWNKKDQRYRTCNIGSQILCYDRDCWQISREIQGLIPKDRVSANMRHFNSGGSCAY